METKNKMDLDGQIQLSMTRLVDIILHNRYLSPVVIRDKLSEEKYRIINEWKESFTDSEIGQFEKKVEAYHFTTLILESSSSFLSEDVIPNRSIH